MRGKTLVILGVLAAGVWWGSRRLPGFGSDSSSDSHTEHDRADAGLGAVADGPVRTAATLADLAGQTVDIELISGAPALVYAGRSRDDAADASYRAAVQSASGGAGVYDRDLAHAAREFAYQYATYGRPPPGSAMTFLLHSSGAPDFNAAQFMVRTTSDNAKVLRDAISGALGAPTSGGGTLLVGVGEAATPGQRFTRHIIVLTARRDYEIDPTPRHAPLDSTWVLRGRFADDFHDPSANVLYPDGALEKLDVELDGRNFTVRIATRGQAGPMSVGIDGVSGGDPGKLLQLSVELGGDPPSRFKAIIPDVEGPFADVDAAEQFALGLLNHDRRGAGRTTLELDPALSRIARGHSVDMRDNGFFGHRSPTTGLVSARLKAAGYRATAYAENLAKNDSIAEAQSSLMYSVGHRRNLLGSSFTHVGVGLAERVVDDRTEWFLTQVFARKVVKVDPVAARDRLVATVNAARAARGAPSLDLDTALSALAQRGASRAADGDVDGLAEELAEDSRSRTDRGAAVSVQIIYDLTSFEPPSVAIDREMTRIGIGVLQSTDDAQGRTGLVLIVAR